MRKDEVVKMLITRQSDYAIRLLRGIRDGENHPVGELCEEEAVPQQYAYRVLKKLEKAGYVKLTRGVGGGCRLTADLSKVSLLDVIEATEIVRYVNACMDPDYNCTWEEKNNKKCTVNIKLAALQRKINDELNSYSISDLITG